MTHEPRNTGLFKVTDFSINRKPICDFLSVIIVIYLVIYLFIYLFIY